MMATTHQLFGFTFALGAFTVCEELQKVEMDPLQLGIFTVSVLFGAILPDIDEPKSKLGSRLPLISYPMNWIFGHRQITHSIAFIILTAILSMISYIVFEWSFVFVIGLTIGVMSHITGDYITNTGVPLFAPITNKRFKFIFTFKTGGIAEKLIAICLIILNYKWTHYLFEKGYF